MPLTCSYFYLNFCRSTAAVLVIPINIALIIIIYILTHNNIDIYLSIIVITLYI